MLLSEILAIGNEYFADGLVITLIYATVVYIICYFIKKLIKKTVDSYAKKKGVQVENSYSFLKKLLYFLVNVLFIMFILMRIKPLQHLGQAMLGASSIIALVVGVAAQETVANFIGGFSLSYYQPFKIGDLITIKDSNITGIVKEMGFRQTVIRTFENTDVIIPNKTMNTAIIENKDFTEAKICNFLNFGISYDSDIDKAIAIIQREACAHPNCIDARTKKEKEKNDPIVKVLVTDLKDYSVNLRASIYTTNFAKGFGTCCDLRKSIKEAFDKEGIKIPFPTAINYVKNDQE